MVAEPVEIPEQFAADTLAREGAVGRVWLDSLEDRVHRLLERWGLHADGAVMHGYLGIVLPMLRGSEACALKVTWVDRYNEHEIDALLTWAGHGAVELLEYDRQEGALLLERLDSSRNLQSLAPSQAAEVAGRLLRRLAISAPLWAPQLVDEAALISEALPEDWQELGRPCGKEVLDKALRHLDELVSDRAALLVNSDLHYENVLAGHREPWLAIDPKVVSGCPEYGVAQLIWQSFASIHSKRDLEERLGTIARAADLNPDLARAWTFVRVVEFWLWGLKAGLTHDPVRCEQLVRWL